jgi:DNA repair exonuclease SbcCD ATPase subunit
MSDLINDIDDLILQATHERSHFYVGSVLKRAKQRIEELEAQITSGWRSCIDHIIKPSDPCPVCLIEELEAENDKQRREIAELQTFLRGHQHNIGELLKGREAP